MILHCPVCRAENSAGPLCRRCRADLSLLVSIEDRRAFHLARVQVALREARLDDALDPLTTAEQHRSGPDVNRLWACLFLLAGDPSAAFTEYRAVS